MVSEMLTEVEKEAQEIRDAVLVFTPGQFNEHPAAASWSAAQTAEHVLKSVAGISSVLEGNHRLADRDPFERIPAIREIFLDFNSKMTSPEFILPSGSPPSKDEILQRLQEKFKQITV